MLGSNEILTTLSFVRDIALTILRRIQRVHSEARDQCLKAVAVTKMIRRDLEVAAEFDIRVPMDELLERLALTGHILVMLPHNDNYVVFVPSELLCFSCIQSYLV